MKGSEGDDVSPPLTEIVVQVTKGGKKAKKVKSKSPEAEAVKALDCNDDSDVASSDVEKENKKKAKKEKKKSKKAKSSSDGDENVNVDEKEEVEEVEEEDKEVVETTKIKEKKNKKKKKKKHSEETQNIEKDNDDSNNDDNDNISSNPNTTKRKTKKKSDENESETSHSNPNTDSKSSISQEKKSKQKKEKKKEVIEFVVKDDDGDGDDDDDNISINKNNINSDTNSNSLSTSTSSTSTTSNSNSNDNNSKKGQDKKDRKKRRKQQLIRYNSILGEANLLAAGLSSDDPAVLKQLTTDISPLLTHRHRHEAPYDCAASYQNGEVSIEFLESAFVYLQVADSAYQPSIELAAKLSGLRPENFITFSSKAEIFFPAFFIAIDHERELIITSVRGSWEWNDWLTNFHVLLEYLPPNAINGFAEASYVHHGFYQSMLSLLKIVIPIVTKQASQYPDYRIRFTGHSLGGAVAALLALVTSDIFPSARAVTFAAPVVGSMNLAEFSHTRVLGFANARDLIPRAAPEKLSKLLLKVPWIVLKRCKKKITTFSLSDLTVHIHPSLQTIANTLTFNLFVNNDGEEENGETAGAAAVAASSSSSSGKNPPQGKSSASAATSSSVKNTNRSGGGGSGGMGCCFPRDRDIELDEIEVDRSKGDKGDKGDEGGNKNKGKDDKCDDNKNDDDDDDDESDGDSDGKEEKIDVDDDKSSKKKGKKKKKEKKNKRGDDSSEEEEEEEEKVKIEDEKNESDDDGGDKKEKKKEKKNKKNKKKRDDSKEDENDNDNEEDDTNKDKKKKKKKKKSNNEAEESPKKNKKKGKKSSHDSKTSSSTSTSNTSSSDDDDDDDPIKEGEFSIPSPLLAEYEDPTRISCDHGPDGSLSYQSSTLKALTIISRADEDPLDLRGSSLSVSLSLFDSPNRGLATYDKLRVELFPLGTMLSLNLQPDGTATVSRVESSFFHVLPHGIRRLMKLVADHSVTMYNTLLKGAAELIPQQLTPAPFEDPRARFLAALGKHHYPHCQQQQQQPRPPLPNAVIFTLGQLLDLPRVFAAAAKEALLRCGVAESAIPGAGTAAGAAGAAADLVLDPAAPQGPMEECLARYAVKRKAAFADAWPEALHYVAAEIPPREGAGELLGFLAEWGIPVAVIAEVPADTAMELLCDAQIGATVETVVGRGEVPHSGGTSPAGILLACQRLEVGCFPSTVLVGGTEERVAVMARNAGVCMVCVNGGDEERGGSMADLRFGSLREFWEYLRSIVKVENNDGDDGENVSINVGNSVSEEGNAVSERKRKKNKNKNKLSKNKNKKGEMMEEEEEEREKEEEGEEMVVVVSKKKKKKEKKVKKKNKEKNE